MNLDQITRLALFQADQITQAGTVGSFVTTTELVAWANQANRYVETALRALREDYFLRTWNSSTDTTATRIMGIDYTPSTSLRIAADTIRYTLPPDFLSVKYIRAVTAGYEFIKFFPRDISHADMQGMLFWSTDNSATPGRDMYFDIQADRTMLLLPALNATVDIEFSYISRSHPLVRYATGTLAITTATTAATGVGTTWSTLTPFDVNYLDIMFGSSGSATLPTVDPTWDYDQANLARVSTITNDTTLDIAANKIGTLAAGTGYILSSVPVVPNEHHYLLADYVTFRILAKQGSRKAVAYRDLFRDGLTSLQQTSGVRQQLDAEFVDPWLPEGR